MFDRLELLIGKDGLLKLNNSNVLIIGLGGVGGCVLESLIRSGVGQVTIVDSDKIELSNLNRQIIATRYNIGKYKTDEFEKRIKSINPDVVINKITEFIDKDNIDLLFENSIDFLVDACDTYSTKCLIIEKCLSKKIPFITCTGTGNRMDTRKLDVIDIRKTMYDPLAKKIRKYVNDNNIKGSVMCLTSKEVPLRKGKVIGSNSFVPPSAGLLISNYVIEKLLEE